MNKIPSKNIQLICQKLFLELKTWSPKLKMLVSQEDFVDINADFIQEELEVQDYLNERAEELLEDHREEYESADSEKALQMIRRQIIKEENLVLMINPDEKNSFISIEKQRDIAIQIFNSCLTSKLFEISSKAEIDEVRVKTVRFFEKELGKYEEAAVAIAQSLKNLPPYSPEYKHGFDRAWQQKFPGA